MPGFLRRREREVPPQRVNLKTGHLIKRIYPNPAIYEEWDVIVPLSQYGLREVTFDSVNQGPPYKSGSDFANLKVDVDHNVIKGVGTYTTNPVYKNEGSPWYEYTGGFIGPDLIEMFGVQDSYLLLNVDDPLDSGLITPDVAALGDEAYTKMSPKLSKADASVFLAEIRDVPHMLSGSARGFHDAWRLMGGNGYRSSGKISLAADLIMKPKKLGDHFINHQFGWVPFLNDLQKFNSTYQDAAKIMGNIRAHNGLWMKRNCHLAGSANETLVSHIESPQIGPWGDIYKGFCEVPEVVNGILSYGYSDRILSNETLNWAKGSVQYYRPEFDASLPDYNSGWNDLQRNLIIYGARINPSVVWRATPWTWLVDWHTNVGNTIDRASAWANDGVVWQYLYLMSQAKNVITHSSTVHFVGGDKTLSWRFYTSSKFRQNAGTPFGFTLKGPLSARQLAILAALGISRKH